MKNTSSPTILCNIKQTSENHISRKIKTLSLQRCALRKFLVTDGRNTRDQITSDRTLVIKLRYVHSIHS